MVGLRNVEILRDFKAQYKLKRTDYIQLITFFSESVERDNTSQLQMGLFSAYIFSIHTHTQKTQLIYFQRDVKTCNLKLFDATFMHKIN